MSIGNFEFKNGMTIKELKEIIRDWPEEDKYGEPAEVWVETGRNLSSPVTFGGRLNMTDLILKSEAFD